MPKNLPALSKQIFISILIFTFIAGGNCPAAQDNIFFQEGSDPGNKNEIRWYRSNSAGMTLELIPSQAAALRNEYCLSVQPVLSIDIPEILIPYYEDLFTIELRLLYENSSEIRRQWIFRDLRGVVRLTSSGSSGLYSGAFFAENTADEEKSGEEDPEDGDFEEKISGFIEIRDNEGSLTRELRFEEDRSAWDSRYNYREKALFSAETWYRPPPSGESRAGTAPYGVPEADDPGFFQVSTDYYRYSRSGSLRAIDRTLHEETGSNMRIGFPAIGTGLSRDGELFTGGIAYTSQFLQDIYSPEGTTISYSFDSRGRITREVWKDPDDTIIGEFRNTWDGDRLSAVLWKSNDEERLVEYEYDSSGSRILERNFKNQELERIVRSHDEKDTEEIYMNGNLVLRAYWEKGLKISEEWILSGVRNR